MMIEFNILNRGHLRNIISCLLMYGLLFISNLVVAQATIVKGVVTETNGSPMIGVSIAEKNTPNGTITDIDGSYSLKVNSTASVLVFNYLGYATQEVTVGNKLIIDIMMQQDSKILDDIIVTGYRRC